MKLATGAHRYCRLVGRSGMVPESVLLFRLLLRPGRRRVSAKRAFVRWPEKGRESAKRGSAHAQVEEARQGEQLDRQRALQVVALQLVAWPRAAGASQGAASVCTERQWKAQRMRARVWCRAAARSPCPARCARMRARQRRRCTHGTRVRRRQRRAGCRGACARPRMRAHAAQRTHRMATLPSELQKTP
jgi:hypothetical protein